MNGFNKPDKRPPDGLVAAGALNWRGGPGDDDLAELLPKEVYIKS